jgi:hypothetical protein
VRIAFATDNTKNPDNFAEFIGCLFGGAGETADDNTAQNVVDAIEGTTQSVPRYRTARKELMELMVKGKMADFNALVSYCCFLLALTFSLYSLLVGLALNRIPQHSQNSLSVKK